MHWCILSTVATDALVLKHQAISIYSADEISIALDWLQKKNYIYTEHQSWENIMKFWK